MRAIPISTKRLWALYRRGYSAAEVAAHVGMKTVTVKARFRREGLPMRPNAAGRKRPARWYANVAAAKTANGTWAPSRYEDIAARRLREHGIRFVRNMNIGPFAVDFAIRAPRIVIEIDSSWHRRQRALDAKRDRRLRRLGWRVIRVRWNGRMTGARAIPAALRRAGLID